MFSYNGTPTNGIKIKTNIPFNSSSYAMPLVKIEGYSYGKAASLGLLINWYNYGYSNQFLNHGVCSFGSFAPPVTIAEENGLVVIFLGIGGDVYYQRFVVSVQESGYPQHQTSHFTGWTAVDEAISGSATNVNSLAYSADFGDGMTWKNDLFQVGPWSSQQKSLAMNTSDLGGGVGVIGIANAATTPASTPSGGGVLFVESGALKFKGSSGTVTTIAPA